MLKITELAGMLDCFHPSIAEEEKVVTVRDLDDLHAATVQVRPEMSTARFMRSSYRAVIGCQLSMREYERL
ncbi:MAG: hypothetical protein KGL39_43060 [Patescibacteria group bacterium]|nr:hypothetical protein [Patescibacteria group bacterium]